MTIAAALQRQFQQGAPSTADGHPVLDLAGYDHAFGVDCTGSLTGFDGEVP